MDNVALQKIVERAIEADKTIILPEADDPRVILASDEVIKRRLANVILLGNEEQIRSDAERLEADISAARIIDPLDDEKREQYVDTFHQRRKHKGLERRDADEILKHPVYYAGMMVDDGRADGMVAGSKFPTGDTVRTAIYCVGTTDDTPLVSSASMMITVVKEAGVEGSLIFADTGVVPEPDSGQLAEIAISTAATCRQLLGVEPCIAMLSFSSKGSAKSDAVKKVVRATQIVQERRPELQIDGELQLDAAIVPEVAKRKAPSSPVASKANTLIFPNLSAGNIGYKLVERLGKAMGLGPLLQGLKKPVNDLSRGSNQRDIALITAITAVQACDEGK